MNYPEHARRVAELPCCLCGQTGVEVHHIREGVGLSKRAHDLLVIPLCPSCHRGSAGVHGDRSMLRITKKGELDHLGETYAKIFYGKES